jgi:hypothetical protein
MASFCFTPSPARAKRKSAPKAKREPEKKDLTAAPARLINNGLTIEWGSNDATGLFLTEKEKRLICQKCGLKKVNEARALAVKSLMQFKTAAQIVAHFKGRRGMGERMVYGIHAALSEAIGERK